MAGVMNGQDQTMKKELPKAIYHAGIPKKGENETLNTENCVTVVVSDAAMQPPADPVRTDGSNRRRYDVDVGSRNLGRSSGRIDVPVAKFSILSRRAIGSITRGFDTPSMSNST